MRLLVAIALCITALPGCVTHAAHKDALDTLERLHDRIVAMTVELETERKRAADKIHALQETNDWLGGELMKVRHLASQRATELQSLDYHLGIERQKRHQAESHMKGIETERQKYVTLVSHLEDELDKYMDKVTSAQTAKKEASGRLAAFKREREKLVGKLREAQSRVQMLDALMALDRQVVKHPGPASISPRRSVQSP